MQLLYLILTYEVFIQVLEFKKKKVTSFFYRRVPPKRNKIEKVVFINYK